MSSIVKFVLVVLVGIVAAVLMAGCDPCDGMVV